jgi:hypothetical protein
MRVFGRESRRPRVSVLGLDFRTARRVGIALLVATSLLVVAYWVLWFADRSIIASAESAQYISFEQSFPLADGWLLTVALLAAVQTWRRRPGALLWLLLFGGAGIYLCAMDVLYDLEHGIYGKGHGGISELVINLATAAVSIGAIASGWRFRRELLEDADRISPAPETPVA